MLQISHAEAHRDHRVLAIYDDSEATVFQLPLQATLADLCERLAARSPGHTLPVHVEVHLGH